MGVTPNYLSRILRVLQEIPVSVSWARNRWNEAKKPLRDSSFKSYEVAEAVGVQESHYFGAIFKRYTVYARREEYQEDFNMSEDKLNLSKAR